MANISVVGRIVSDDIELKISTNNRPYLRFDLAERTGKGAYARTQYYQVVAFGAISSQFAKRGLCRGALIRYRRSTENENPCPDRMPGIRGAVMYQKDAWQLLFFVFITKRKGCAKHE